VGKRSNFERRERDFYPTPYEAVVPLLPYLSPRTKFTEPCAGNGALVDHLELAGHSCVWRSDVEPQRSDIARLDARHFTPGTDVITNPPWDRPSLHGLLDHWLGDGNSCAWLLFDADWMHTRQAIPYLRHVRRIVAVGRVKWIPDSKFTGKDNCCWYRFDPIAVEQTAFIGRAA